MEKRTAFYDKHTEAGGKMVPFAGYTLPVQYKTGILKEHNAVRQQAGLFDVSHMGEFFLEGQDAFQNLNNILTNDFTGLQPGQVRYSPMCYENGGTVDDLLVYKINDEKYLVVVNAANREKDFEWMQKRLTGDVSLRDDSDNVSQLALQGPAAQGILEKIVGEGSIPERYYTFTEQACIGDIPCLISRTGYTGEDGFEIYTGNKHAEALWDILMEAGEEYGLIPCGLGARDTLRLEAGMPLYGHELSPEITPREANLSIFVKLDKPVFTGRDVLAQDRKRKRIGIKLTGKGIAREGAEVYSGEEKLGLVTSGTMSPSLGVAIAMAIVPVEFAGSEVEVDVRGKRIKAEVLKLPFYHK
ncbi:glycine cleavage system aminomethyltransferase GcvT [Christensenellaceae bacterium OttesenSCG-928-K19]|nr:glycine cleavage system aminomethyltransferase GcvT [Christensenellaceae bacterium OttesenSCG-928-K19]